MIKDVIYLIFLASTVVMLSAGVEIMYICIKKNSNMFKVYCKQCQTWLFENQKLVFLISNVFIFFLAASLYSAEDVLVVQFSWLFIFTVVKFLIDKNVPLLEVFLGGILIVRLVFGLIPISFVFLVLFLVYVYFLLELIGITEYFIPLINNYKKEQNIIVSHKKTEFEYFYTAEIHSLIFLIFKVVVISLFRQYYSIPFYISHFFDIYYFLTLLFICFSVCANLAIILFFNVKTQLATQVIGVCLGCLTVGITGVAVEQSYDQAAYSQASGGTLEPGSSSRVQRHQMKLYGCTAPTKNGLQATQTHWDVYGSKPPQIAGTTTVDLHATQKKFFEEKDLSLRNHITFITGKDLPDPLNIEKKKKGFFY